MRRILGPCLLAGLLAFCVACQPVPDAAALPAPAPGVPRDGAAGAALSAANIPPSTPAAPPQLPRGGKTIFPRYRVVTYYGTGGTASLGVLGSAPPEQIAGKLEQAAAGFGTPDRTVQPAMELIVAVADSKPGPDGSYSHPIDPAVARRYLDAARAHQQMLVLDIQPGRSEFLPEVQRWADLLTEPDVGLALDPEWRMDDDQVPGKVIGHVDAPEVNAVGSWLADLTRDRRLPQKLFVLHMFTGSMVTNVAEVAAHPELAMVQHLDGFGSQAVKKEKYRVLQRPAQFHMGFKLFYTQDLDLLEPAEVLALAPPPEYVSYQ